MIGLLFNGRLRCWQHRPRRFWLLRRALQLVLRWGEASGEVLRVLSGHLVHFFMLNRPALSILDVIYKFSRENLGRARALPRRAPL